MIWLPGRLELRATAHTIAACQGPEGAIAWELVGDTAGKVDPWDHVECAMALTVVGLGEAAAAAYEFLRETQRADGTWPREWRRDAAGVLRLADAGTGTNLSAYVAVGVWHHWCSRRDRAALERWWPMVCAALEAVIGRQLDFGAIAWADDPAGRPAQEALVTGNSSIHHALRCGIALAEVVGEARPDWEFAADEVAEALRHAEHRFSPRTRHSMDWYYPVLGGALVGAAAAQRLAARWDDFVVEGLGIRCVDDHPWVTGAETCELALALTRLGRRGEAARLIGDMQHLRDESGAYHTGFVYADGKRWPIEMSSWTGAAVILAVAALDPGSATARVFGSG
ncbi:prenyltransferase [Naumannella sp. ID2617S]|nr:prenyltransferase [Naumannella sp. ID2617S]